MNWFDLVLVLVILGCAVSGLAKGFSRTAIGFATFLIAIGCALWFYVPAGFWFRSFLDSRVWANGAGFLSLFMIVMVIGGLIERAASRFVVEAELTWLDRLLGMVAGAAQGVLTAAWVVLVVLAFVPRPLPQFVTDSRIVPDLTGAARVLAHAAPDEVKSGFQSARNDLEKVLPRPMRKGLEKFTAVAN